MQGSIADQGALPPLLVFIISSILFAVLGIVIALSQVLGNLLTFFSGLVYALIIITLYTNYAVLNHHTSSDLFGMMMLIIFITYTMVPLTLRVSTTLNVTFSIFHIIITSVIADRSQSSVIGHKVSEHMF